MKALLIFCGSLLIIALLALNFQLARLSEATLSIGLKQNVRIEDASWKALNRIHLKGIQIGEEPAGVQIEEAELRMKTWAPPEFFLSLREIEVPAKLLGRFRILGSVFRASLDESVLIPELRFAIHVKPEKVIAQIYKSNLPNVWVRGGLAFQGEKLQKLNALILFSDPKILNKIPKSMQDRLVKRAPNLLGAKIIYAANRIRMQGAMGPLLEAEWAF